MGLKFQPTQGMPARPTLSSMRHQWPIFSSMSGPARVISSQAGMKMLFSFRPWASTFSRAWVSASVQSLPALIS